MKPGTTFIYEGGTQRGEMTVTHDTRKVMGVECVVVDHKGWEGGKLIERTYDWFAQDDKGTVWYFGEDTKEYENGEVVSTKGSWEAGVDGAKPGIIMQADPKVGQSYHQEYYPGEAMDMARVISFERIGHGALRFLRSRAGDQGVDAAPTRLIREEVLRTWGWPTGQSEGPGTAGCKAQAEGRMDILPARSARERPELPTAALVSIDPFVSFQAANSQPFHGLLRILSELSRIILAVRCLARGRETWRLTHRGTDEDEESVQQTAQAPRTQGRAWLLPIRPSRRIRRWKEHDSGSGGRREGRSPQHGARACGGARGNSIGSLQAPHHPAAETR